MDRLLSPVKSRYDAASIHHQGLIMTPSSMASLPFPAIDPVALCLGPVPIRWYALAYLAGILLGWWLLRRLTARADDPVGQAPLDSMINAGVIGIILGGRLVYVAFYNLPYYLQHPVEILMVWQGGMAFHGGFLGMIGAILWVARHHKISPIALGDLVALVAPIGLFFGRIANFINAELYGRITDVPWGMVFLRPLPNPDGPCAASDAPWQPVPPGLPRHPSQLYEAALEGLVLFAILWLIHQRGGRHRPGLLIGVFIAGYGTARTLVEFFREPDTQLGYLLGGATMGQLLSLPMIIIGALVIWQALARRPQA